MKLLPFSLLLLTASVAGPLSVRAQEAPLGSMSYNQEIQVLPAPGPVVIDGKTNDWDLSAGVWSYNNPTIVEKYSVWTHLMWDARGIYFLARYHDRSPLQNSTQGKDFSKSWRADAYQARVIFDDKTPDEHQMHVNVFYSTPEQKPYMIVKHGGFGDRDTGPDRPDLLERFGATMEKAGGQVAFQAWPDGKGYNAEAFWPWSYARLGGQPLKPGEQFIFGIEAMWGNGNGTSYVHRLADGINNEKANRVFMFRARSSWGRAVITNKGGLGITAQQEALQARRLKAFVDYDTHGSVPIEYTLPSARDVTIAIENEAGRRVRNLFGQYPRPAGKNTDLWDGLDDAGKPVPPGKYSAIVLDHEPVKVTFLNSVYNAGTPPWKTDIGGFSWGSNHGYPTSVATRGETIIAGFTGTEGTSGLLRSSAEGLIQWANQNEVLDATVGTQFVYSLSRDSWTKRTVVRRLTLDAGQITPFEDASRSPEIVLVDHSAGIESQSSIALQNNHLFALVYEGGQGTLYIVNPANGAIEQRKDAAGLLAVTDRDEALYGLYADGAVCKLNDAGEKAAKVFTAAGLSKPMRLAVSQDLQRFAISDAEDNLVRIYDAAGKLQRTLGHPYHAVDGERPAGKFIETNFINPLGLDFDSNGGLWVAEGATTSKRITVWSPQGELRKQLWGAADYGAMAGFPIPGDSTRFIAHGVEFQLDPAPAPLKRPTQEKPLMFHPALSHNRGLVYRHLGRDYAVTLPGYNGGGGRFLIAVRDANGVFQPRVRVSYASGKNKEGTAWTDANANGQEDAGETVTGVQGKAHYWSAGWMRPDLTIITPDSLVYPLRGITPTGVPLYDFTHPVKPRNAVPLHNGQGSTGTMVMDDAGDISDGIYYHTVAGRSGSYPNPYGRHDAPAAQRGLLIAPFRTNGVVEGVPGAGAITALGGDRGEWFLMTMDGLYLSSILQDTKGDATLDETFTGQESFGGFMWRDEKGRVLVQLGGISYRIMQIGGLETTRRNATVLQVSAAQIAAGAAIAAQRAGGSAQQATQLTIAHLAKLPAAPAAPDETGELMAGAGTVRVQETGNPSRWFRTALAQDGKDLAVMYQVADPSPWKNGEGRFTHLFIGGDAVDLKLDVPGRGLIRLLAAPLTGRDTAVYWQKEAAAPEAPQTYIVGNNAGNATKFDTVKRLGSAVVRHEVGISGYSVLVRVSLADLGLDAATVTAMKGDIGVIFSDPAGTNRAARLYWHDKATDLVSDVPTEARLSPQTWGEITVAK